MRRALESIENLLAALEKRTRPDLPLVLTREEAARLLSVSQSTVKSMLRDGEIIPTQVHGRTMVPTSEVVRISRPKAAPMRQQRRRSPRAEGRTEAEKIRASLKAARLKPGPRH